ncbi:MAG: alpha-methylacyl-CoA racemase [Oleiphilaceae bacterium]|jgi:alpha-methylacyl-CoA racemase
MTLPLKGIKVLDFTTLLPGPYATQLLADMGAEVIRVESPTRPDLVKFMPPMVGEGKNKVSAVHASLNRNKQFIAIDLKSDSAKEIIYRLIMEYDIVIEQFRPNVMKRLGLDYESLKIIQPKLIYCSITGYGQTGPLKDRAGHDINYLALSGLASYSGRKETGPVLSGTQIADIAGGSHHAVMAVQAAIIQRAVSGAGQYLDISMSDAALAMTTMFGASALASGKPLELGGEMLNGGLFYDYYETADGRYLSLGSLEPVFANKVLEVLGMNEWASKLTDQRCVIQHEVREQFKTVFKQHSFEHWLAIFESLDACVEPVLTIEETFSHPHFIERGMISDALMETGESIPQLNSALPFRSEKKHQAGRGLGVDTDTVLRRIGFGEPEINVLRADKVIK